MSSVGRASPYPLSPMQQGLLFHSLYEGSAGLYIQQLVCAIHEELNVTAFVNAWQQLFTHQSTLRTGFRWDGTQGPVQEVHSGLTLPFAQEDWRNLDHSEQEARLASYLLADRQRGFRFDEAPLMRCSLLRLRDDYYRFIWTSHHALFDGRSRLLLLQQLSALYEDSSREPESVPFRDYIDWLDTQNLPAAESFWREELRGFDSPTPLISQPSSVDGDHKEQTLQFTSDETTTLQAFALRHDLTMNSLLQGAWALLLSRCSGEEDVVFGTTRSCRRSLPFDAESMIGLVVNTVPLRVAVHGASVLLDWLKELRAKNIALREYEHTPLVKIQEWSEVPKGSTLFESLVVFENYQLGAVLRGESTLWRNAEFQLIEHANYPLSLVGYGGRELLLKLSYDRQRFDEATIAQLLGHLRTLLLGFAGNPSQKLRDIVLLTPVEQHQLLVEWNRTTVDYPEQLCVHQLFERQAQQTPGATAVRSEDAELSYRELDVRANQLANYLRASGVGPEKAVPICVERSVQMVVGLLGVMKAGAAYVPLDPDYPQERIDLMLNSTGANLVLTQGHLNDRFSGFAGRVVNVDESFAGESTEALQTEVTPGNIAYVIYTSGSTGRPKGVMVEHRGLRNLCEAQVRAFELKPGRHALQFASLSFDASASEIFTALTSGATLHLAAKESLTNSLPRLLRDREITTVTLPPSLLAVLPANDLPSLHTVISAGEACPREVAARWSVNHRFLNAYGPTELSVCATIAECDGSSTPPLGDPINNTQVYLLDSQLQPVPFGVPGELYVGGAGLARGYVGSPELTAERFVPNPFSETPGARLYKTGDLARAIDVGKVEYIGRSDHQTKVRGFRVEPGEIEAVLRAHPGVRDALVVLREDKRANKQLVAYCIAESSSPRELKGFLTQRLPDYMMPAAFVLLDAWPLTRNGKIDRRALPSPDFSRSQHDGFVAPRNQFEEAVAGVWLALLDLERVGVHDNFLELGGHSLLAMQVVSRLRETLGVELPLRLFFSDPTIESLAHHAQTALASTQSVSPIVKFTSDDLPLASFAQQRLWLLEQLDPDNSAYNISKFLRLNGELDQAAIESALTELVRRHESLRTTFTASDGQPRQVITPPPDRFQLSRTDLSREPEREASLQQLLHAEVETPFDLSSGPLFRAGLLRLAEHEHVFYLSMHHIVSDGWSMSLLFREFSALYSAALHQQQSPLPELPIQYADYALWQRDSFSGELLAQQLDYWRRQLQGAPAVLELPADYARPAQQSYHGHTHRLALDQALVTRLKQFSQQSGCTLFMTLLAAFKVLLHRYTGQPDIVVGTPVVGRNRGELEGLIGFFVNTLVLRTELSDNPSFKELLARVREVCLGAYAHQELPFEKLVEELQPERSLSHMPLFQVMFSLLEVDPAPLSLAGLETSEVKIERLTTKSDLTLLLAPQNDGELIGNLYYRTELFHPDTIRRLADEYVRVLHEVLDQPASRVSEIDLMSPAERRQLLEEWTQLRHHAPDECLHKLFEAQVELRPGATAVRGDSTALSYYDLNFHANQLARHLRMNGVGPEQAVAICLERSVEMIVALLAVLKTGAAYVPVDPDYPQQRIAFILDETRARFVLTSQHVLPRLPENKATRLCLDSDWPLINKQGNENLQSEAGSQNAAYIIYTSGSTGTAKGVVVEHRQLVSYVNAISQQLELNPGDSFAFLSSFAADLSYTAIFPSLCSGGTLVVLPPTLGMDAAGLSRYLEAHPIDRLKIVPSHLRALLDLSPQKASLVPRKQLILGGEATGWDLIETVEQLNPSCRIINHYGPTETTVGVLTCDVQSQPDAIRKSGVPLGRPLANAHAYILDRELQPVPIRTPGELYIGGNSLARGYLARPDLTAERFIPHPFSQIPGARLYRTGDNARYLPEGNIEYLGRSDHQVKLRGFRVELGEIESVLAQHPLVREATVVVKELAPGDQRLLAYFVPQESSELSFNDLAGYLRQRLPEYMIPSMLIALEHMPRTSSGKVDRKSLPAAGTGRVSSRKFVLPRTPIEKIVAGVFSATLNVDQVGAEDNFFELGGHSLLAMQVISRLREMLKVDVPLRSLFEAPTVAELSTQILARESTTGQTEKIARIIMRLHDANSHPAT